MNHPYIKHVREQNKFISAVWCVRDSVDFCEKLRDTLKLLNAAISADDQEKQQLYGLLIWSYYETCY